MIAQLRTPVVISLLDKNSDTHSTEEMNIKDSGFNEEVC